MTEADSDLEELTRLVPIYRYKDDAFQRRTLRNFFFCLESVAQMGAWNDLIKTLVAVARMRGAAKQRAYVTLGFTSTDYDKFKKNYESYVHASPAKLRHLLQNCVQEPKENARDFAARVQVIAEDLYPEPEASAMKEFHVLVQFFNGSLNPIKNRLWSSNPDTLEQAIEISLQETKKENQDRKRQERNGGQPRGNRRQRNFNCYRCGQAGHFARDCQEGRAQGQ